MKKYFSILLAALFALGFTACEDVPAPYEINNGGSGSTDEGGTMTTIFSEEFDNGQGSFVFSNVSLSGSLSYVWKATSYNSSTYLIASAFASQKCNAAESWAVSPAINLSDCKKAILTFRHAINKIGDGVPSEMMTVWASTDFAGDAATATWTQLTVPTYPEGTSWTFLGSGDISLNDYCGQAAVYIGFKYISTDEAAGSWEVDAFKIEGDGTPMETPDTPAGPENPGDEPDTPGVSGENLLANGDFETWTGGKPDNWATASTAGNGTLSQSPDAHSGSYSVQVTGASSGNKRLAYKELDLKAGTYTFSFYVKAATADGASVTLGYVPVTDGKAGTYVYERDESGSYKYYNNLSNTEWKQISATFEIASAGTYSFVVMNSKSPGKDVLIDDASLSTSNGGVSGGNEPATPDTPAGDELYSIDFKATQGEWTINDVLLPDGGTYVWQQNSRYGMKASAFVNQVAQAAESWLISPKFDLSGVSKATLSFSHAQRFAANAAKELFVLASTDGTNWTQLNVSAWPDGSNWNYIDATCDLAAFAGKKDVQIAFKYTSTTAAAATWEIASVSIK